MSSRSHDPRHRPLASGVRAVDEFGRRLLNAWSYKSEHLTTSVGRAHVWRAEGSGALPPLLLVHGLGSAAMHWIPMVEHLRPHVQSVVAVDLLGHGFSERPDVLTNDLLRVALVEALSQVDLGPALMIGNSLGGAVALRYANAYPERVAGLLLFSPAGAPLTAGELDQLRRLFSVDSYEAAVRFMYNLQARPGPIRSRLAAPWVRSVLSDPALRSWLNSVPAHEDGDPEGIYVTPEEIRSVNVPFQVVWGTHDRVLPSSAREFWRQNLPSGALVDAANVGHTPFLDNRRWTAEHIRSFAAGLVQRERPT
jgi:pimeloyl-ACP methyl ester carboxylesterase